MNYIITSIPSESDEITHLTKALFQDLELKYGKGSLEDFIAENRDMLIFFIIKMNGGIPAACGALKHFDNKTAELKRMYVKDEFRGKGLSKLILNELEATALNMNYTRIILETGLKQPAAIQLYENSGYTKIKPYGRHKDDPDSVCFEKAIL